MSIRQDEDGVKRVVRAGGGVVAVDAVVANVVEDIVDCVPR